MLKYKFGFIFVLILCLALVVGCGGNKPATKTYTMKIVFDDDAAGLGAMKINRYIVKGALPGNQVDKTSDWWIDRPEFGFLGSIGRGSNGTMDGFITATVIIRDSLGNVVPLTSPDQIHWTSPDNPVVDVYNSSCTYSSSVQDKLRLTATCNKIMVSDDPITYETVNLSAEAVVLLVYRSTASDGSQTAYYKMSTNSYVANAGLAEIYKTNEGGIDYINAPYGISLLLNPEIDPSTGEWNGRITGSVKKVPDGLTYTDKLPLNEYATYIIKLANGGYSKVTIFSSTNPLGMATWYSTTDSGGVFNIRY